MSGVTLYVSGKAKKLVTLPELIKKETVKGISRGQTRIRRAAAQGLSQRSIGRALFGGRLSGAYKNIIKGKVREGREGLFSADMKLNGIAAIQEQGGPIAPHAMRRKAKAYQHPGVRHMPAFPFMNRAVSTNRSAFAAEIQKGLDKVARMVN